MKLLLDNLIEKLIRDLDCEKIPEELDIVLEGGAFNGSYELGIMMYIKKLEKLNKIKVRRISGTSVGAILGLSYILDELYLFNDISNKIFQLFKENYNLFKMREILYDVANKHMSDDDYKKFNKKLYLTYFDSKKKKQIIKNKYKNNKDLINQIIKSAYVPFLMDGNITHNGNVDGGYPYIFKKRENIKNRKILYVNITSFKYLKGMFSIKYEKNGNQRLFDGILDVNRFFIKNKTSNFCSYVENWTTIDFFVFRAREFFFVLILALINIMSNIIENIPTWVKEHKYYIWLMSIISSFSHDILSRVIN